MGMQTLNPQTLQTVSTCSVISTIMLSVCVNTDSDHAVRNLEIIQEGNWPRDVLLQQLPLLQLADNSCRVKREQVMWILWWNRHMMAKQTAGRRVNRGGKAKCWMLTVAADGRRTRQCWSNVPSQSTEILNCNCNAAAQYIKTNHRY